MSMSEAVGGMDVLPSHEAADPVPATPSAVEVLELRIHGVNNTAPHTMLDLPVDGIRRVAGDELSSFWEPKPEALARIPAGGRGSVPPGVQREAYSWGGLARTTPEMGGKSAWTVMLNAAGRIGWALLLPFGLTNVAYWTRRVADPPDAPAGRTRGTRTGAASMRVFGLLLTLLFVVTACEVSLDLLANQCFDGQPQACARVGWVLDLGIGWSQARRLAAASLVPAALLIGLWLLAYVSAGRYEAVGAQGPETGMASDQTRGAVHPALATPGFWSGHLMARSAAAMHVAAGLCVVLLATAWPVVFGSATGGTCSTLQQLRPGGGCWAEVSSDSSSTWWFMVTGGLAVLLLVAIVVVHARHAWDAADIPTPDGARRGSRPSAGALLTAAAVLLAVHLGVLALWTGPRITGPLPGLSVAPTIVTALLIGLAVSGLPWRHRNGGLPLLLGAVVALSLLAGTRIAWWLGLAGALAGALACLALGLWPATVIGADAGQRRDRMRSEWRYVAWRGVGPGLLMVLALVTALTLSSVIVLTTGNLLNGARSAQDLLDGLTPARETGHHLSVPGSYVWFGVACTVEVVVLAGFVLAIWLITSRTTLPGAGAADDLAGQPGLLRQVESARRFAAMAHRAERVAALVAVVGGLGAIAAEVLAVADVHPSTGTGLLVTGGRVVVGTGVLVVAAAGLAIVGSLAGGGAFGGRRPLGLVWDLICFLPRAGHPLGPPCYAERTVPELTRRITLWLDAGDDRSRRRRVVLSAHSLGCVLAVAALYALPKRTAPVGDDAPSPAPDRRLTDSVSLITYGSQLRAYFGRLFPELLGPTVLGTPACTSARLWSADPWRNQPEVPPPPVPNGNTVRELLTSPERTPPRWTNLWRRTDYLGFPVYNYPTRDLEASAPVLDDVDLPAEEVDVSGYIATVATHSDYVATTAYRDTLQRMIAPPQPPPPPPPPGGTGRPAEPAGRGGRGSDLPPRQAVVGSGVPEPSSGSGS